ncbi:MAG: IS1182 family transposase [Candidatus Latescibacterota bacterium]
MIKPVMRQVKLEFISIEEMVPKDHLLRKIDATIDFGFTKERLYPLYCADNGKPAIDPVVLFKMVFIGYLYGIRSERQLVRDIEVNVAYRWFLGLGLGDKVPDASTISQNRRRRFDGTDVFRELFEDVVEMVIKKGFADGKGLYTDYSHLKANANKHRWKRKQVKSNVRQYLDDLDKAVEADRAAHGKNPLKPEEPGESEEKEIKESTTDPQSGYLTREGKPQGFYYLDHRTCDGRHNFITDVHVTPANIYDSLVYLERLDYQRKRFDFPVAEVGLDAGYNTPDICQGLVEREIFGVAGYRAPGGRKGSFRKSCFTYDAEAGGYRCPAGQVLSYRTTNRQGYQEYVSDSKVCACCEKLSHCTHSKNHQKVILRHVWESDKEHIRENRLSDRGKAIAHHRSQTIERSFADAKELHGYRYARFRGLIRVEVQCLMTALTQNLKKLALLLDRIGNPSPKLSLAIP